ncbi:MAG TPA: nuclear transport factor 2 family protein [Thermoleophilaceae bacterium]
MQVGLQAYNRGDLEVVELAFHERVEFESPGGVGRLGFEASYRGREGHRAFEAEWRSGWAALRIEPREFIDLGEQVLLLAEIVGRGKGSGISVSQNIATLETLGEDGKIVREQRYFDHSEALEAVGLLE